MGIKGLSNLIRKKAWGYAIASYTPNRFKGMTVAVDASLIIHQIAIAMRTKSKDLYNQEGKLTNHLYGFFYKIINFLEEEIIPIVVFDGKPPEIKTKTIQRRKAAKTKQSFTMSEINLDVVYTILDLMGIPYIVAPGEADVVCAWLTRRDGSNHKKLMIL